jgi:methionyl aminopeptidase
MISIKTKQDIATMREGGKRHAEILRKLVAMVKPGISAAELDVEADRLIAESGDKASFLDYKPRGSRRAYPASLCVSVNDEVVHGIPNEEEKILKEGDIVSLDLGLTHKGLVTDMAVTVPVGKVSLELEQLLEITKKALLAGIKAAKSGKRVSDISKAIERCALPNKYGVVEELSGHGVGYGVHEEPCIPNFTGSGQPDPVLKPGMVIAIEPMFNLGTKDVILDEDDYTFRTADGSPSAHFEHTILIKKGNAEILTV